MQNGIPDHAGGINENASNSAHSASLRLAAPRGQGLNAGGPVPVSPAPLPDLGIGTVGLGSIAEPHWPGSDIVPNESLAAEAALPPLPSASPSLASAPDESRRQTVNDADVGESRPREVEVEQDELQVLEASAEENEAVKKVEREREKCFI